MLGRPRPKGRAGWPKKRGVSGRKGALAPARKGALAPARKNVRALRGLARKAHRPAREGVQARRRKAYWPGAVGRTGPAR